MKKLVVLILLLSFPTAIFAQDRVSEDVENHDDYQSGFDNGDQFAYDNYGSFKWFAAGYGGGLFLGPIGGGVVVGLSQPDKIEPPARIQDIIAKKPRAYQDGFLDGFSKRAKKKRLVSSIIGGVLGTASLYAIIKSLEAAFDNME